MVAFRLLAFVWQLPIALPVWFGYLLPCWAFGWLEYGKRVPGGVSFVVTGRGPGWWDAAWFGWAGHAVPFAVVLNTNEDRIVRHECRHLLQWAVLGCLFPLVYLLLLVLYGYRANPLEVDARKAEDGDA